MTTTKAKDTQLPLGAGPLEEPHEVPVEEVHREPPPTPLPAVVEATDARSMIRLLIEKGGTGPDAVQMMERLVALEERVQERKAREEFFRAFALAKAEIEPIKRTRQGQKFGRESGKDAGHWYAPLPEVEAAVRGPLEKHDFTYKWSQKTSDDGKRLRTFFHLTHIGGHTETNDIELPVESPSGASAQQKVSSAQSFGMRLSMVAGLGLTTFDPDLNGAKLEELEPVTKEQAEDLETLVGDAGMDKEKYLQSLGVTKFTEVKAVQLPFAVQRLRTRIEKRTQQGAAS